MNFPEENSPGTTPGAWKKNVDAEIDLLGWREATRVEQLSDDVTVYMIDVVTQRDLVFHPEGPATFSLSVFLDGAGTLSVDGAKPLTIEPGVAVFFACDRVTRGENHVPGGKRLQIADIRVEKPLLEKLGGISLARLGGAVITDHSLPDEDVFLIGFKAPPELQTAAAALINCRYPEGQLRQVHLYSKAIEALSIGLGALARQQAGDRPVRPLNTDEKRRLERAISLIETHYSEDWTIPRLAREAGLNERRLKEAFRIAIGTSVHAFLRRTRLDAAAGLLASGASVTDAAFATGFENLSHFSKVFREEKGVLPSRYTGR